jgi:hypothetical protein
MTKKQIIAAVVAGVLIALGIAAWVYNNNKETTKNASTTQTTGQSEQSANDTPNTINEFLAVGKNQKCTISTTSGDTKITGTMYFSSNRKMSAEYTSVTADKTTTGNMIITDNVQYFWAPSSNQGVKINLSESVNDGGEAGSSANSGLDTGKQYDFKCQSRTVDEAKFTVPTNVTFLDFSDIQSQLQQ